MNNDNNDFDNNNLDEIPSENGTSNSISNDNNEYTNKYTYSGPGTNSINTDTIKDNKAHNFAITSLILGIVSIGLSLICCCSFFAWALSIICAIIGIIFGYMAKDSNDKREGMAKAGIICSIVGIVLSILMIILSIVFFINYHSGTNLTNELNL